MLACRDTSDDALGVPVTPLRFAARVLMLRALVMLPAAFILAVVVVLVVVFLFCVGCCVCNHTLAESKGCPTRVPVIPAAYPAKTELRIEVEENEVLVAAKSVASEVMVGATAPTEEGCNEVAAIVIVCESR